MVLGFLNIGTSELMFILIVAVFLFGGKKLPELARGLGRGIREFKDASEGIKREIADQINNFEDDLDVGQSTKTNATSAAKATVVAQEMNTYGQKDDEALATASATPEDSTNDVQDQPLVDAAKSDKFPQFGPPPGVQQHNPNYAKVKEEPTSDSDPAAYAGHQNIQNDAEYTLAPDQDYPASDSSSESNDASSSRPA